jgi:hypothetical protein
MRTGAEFIQAELAFVTPADSLDCFRSGPIRQCRLHGPDQKSLEAKTWSRNSNVSGRSGQTMVQTV